MHRIFIVAMATGLIILILTLNVVPKRGAEEPLRRQPLSSL
jgi:hypothetical protein